MEENFPLPGDSATSHATITQEWLRALDRKGTMDGQLPTGQGIFIYEICGRDIRKLGRNNAKCKDSITVSGSSPPTLFPISLSVKQYWYVSSL